MGKVDVWVEMFAVHAGGQDFVPQRQGGLKKSGCARGPFEMPEILFHRTQRHRTGGEVKAAEHIGHALGFDNVAHLG